MSSTSIIPLEIQERVLKHACQRGLGTSSQVAIDTAKMCSLVCTDWNTLTRQWIFRHVKLDIVFASSPSRPSEDANRNVRAVLEYVKANPTILDQIETIHLRLFRNTAARWALHMTAAKEAMADLREICALLADTIREVTLTLDCASLLVESAFLRDAVANLYCGSRVCAVCVHNAMLPASLILLSPYLGKLVLDQCQGIIPSTTVVEGILLKRLKANISTSHNGLSSLVVDNSQLTNMWSALWRFLDQGGDVDAFCSRIKELSFSLSHSVPKTGPWDAKLYTSHLKSLTLSYVSVEGDFVFSFYRRLLSFLRRYFAAPECSRQEARTYTLASANCLDLPLH